MDKVSILVPVYNVEKYIERCAVSLFEQTYHNIEYIFVDDKGSDLSIQILKEVIARYPERAKMTRIIDHVVNRGLAAARNTALENADALYVIHVDSDDFIERDLVEKCVECQTKDGADIVLFGFNHLFADRSHVELQDTAHTKEEYINKLILRETAVCICGGMYKKSLYTDNAIDAIEGLNMGEDYVTKPRLAYFANKISSIDLPLYNYVHYNESSYTNICNTTTIDNLYKAVEVLRTFFSEKNDGTYAKSLEQVDVLQTVLLIKLWAATKSSKQDLNLISQHIKNDFLTTKTSTLNRILLFLAKHKLAICLRVIVWLGLKVKYMFK